MPQSRDSGSKPEARRRCGDVRSLQAQRLSVADDSSAAARCVAAFSSLASPVPDAPLRRPINCILPPPV